MQYLVLATCGNEDFPLLITEDRDKAVAYAERVDDAVPEFIQELFGIDASWPVCTKLVEFNAVDSDGLHPTKVEVLKEFA